MEKYVRWGSWNFGSAIVNKVRKLSSSTTLMGCRPCQIKSAVALTSCFARFLSLEYGTALAMASWSVAVFYFRYLSVFFWVSLQKMAREVGRFGGVQDCHGGFAKLTVHILFVNNFSFWIAWKSKSFYNMAEAQYKQLVSLPNTKSKAWETATWIAQVSPYYLFVHYR